jgi:uncharacterized protein
VFGGAPLRLLEMGVSGEVALFISDDILQETLRVLRDKFSLSPEALARAVHYIDACAVRVKSTRRIDVVKEDPDDNRVLECAEASGSEFIVTGDSDLLRLGSYGATRIIPRPELAHVHGRSASPSLGQAKAPVATWFLPSYYRHGRYQLRPSRGRCGLRDSHPIARCETESAPALDRWRLRVRAHTSLRGLWQGGDELLPG